jgi:hypothetical protein
MQQPQQQQYNHQQRQHPDHIIDSSKAACPRRKQCTSVFVAWSKILGFHPVDCLNRAQNNVFSKVILSGTTNEG